MIPRDHSKNLYAFLRFGGRFPYVHRGNNIIMDPTQVVLSFTGQGPYVGGGGEGEQQMALNQGENGGTEQQRGHEGGWWF